MINTNSGFLSKVKKWSTRLKMQIGRDPPIKNHLIFIVGWQTPPEDGWEKVWNWVVVFFYPLNNTWFVVESSFGISS